MTTTYYIVAGACWLVTCVVAYALGHRDGRRDGFEDGYEARRHENRVIAAQERGADAWARRCAE